MVMLHAPTEVDATILHQYFDKKIAEVCAAIDGAAPPVFTPAPAGADSLSFGFYALAI